MVKNIKNCHNSILVKIHHLRNNSQISVNLDNNPYIPIRFGKVGKWHNFA